MKIAPNPAAFTALSDTDFKKVPRQKLGEADGLRVSHEADKNRLKVDDAKFTAKKADQVRANKKTDTARADQEARIQSNRQQIAAERRSREAPRPRPSAGSQRLGQHVDIRV